MVRRTGPSTEPCSTPIKILRTLRLQPAKSSNRDAQFRECRQNDLAIDSVKGCKKIKWD